MFSKFLSKYSIYLWFLRRNIGEVSTVLDLGCGKGLFMQSLSYNKNWKITGVDIHSDYLKIAKERAVYQQLIQEDLLQSLRQCIKTKKKYDLVFCSQVIEHLDRKKGEELLKLAERIAVKRVIFSTPRGFMHLPEDYLDNNPHQLHQSGWTDKDFRSRGFSVYGVGFKPLWVQKGIIKNKSQLVSVSTLIGYFLSPIIFYLPHLGAGILCVKKRNNF